MNPKKFWEILWTHPGHLVWILAAYLPWLGRMSVPLTGDQKVYIGISMEMWEKGEWLKPLLFGEGSYYKPPFQYWMTLLGWKILGFNLLGTLVPSVVCTVVTGYLLGEIASLLNERRRFIGVGLWFAATLGSITFGTTAQMEIYLCFFMALGWWCALKYLEPAQEKRSSFYLYAAFFVAGFSALNKSPLYSVLWVVGFFTYLLLQGEWELFRKKTFWVALLFGILVSAPWYIYILSIDGPKFWADYAMRETWDKRFGNMSTAPSLWIALTYFCFPFTLLLIPALRSVWKARRRVHQTIDLAIAWIWPSAVFFSLYPYRIKPYLFITVPAYALLVDFGIFHSAHSKFFKFMFRLNGLIYGLALLILSVLIYRLELLPLTVVFGFALLGMIGCWVTFKNAFRVFSVVALASFLIFRISLVYLGERDFAVLKQVAHEQSARSFSMWDERRNIWHEVGLLAAGIEKPMRRHLSADSVVEWIKSGGVVILTDEQASQSLKWIESKIVSDARSVVVKDWPRWKVRAHFPYWDLVKFGRAGITDFDEKTLRIFKIVYLQ